MGTPASSHPRARPVQYRLEDVRANRSSAGSSCGRAPVAGISRTTASDSTHPISARRTARTAIAGPGRPGEGEGGAVAPHRASPLAPRGAGVYARSTTIQADVEAIDTG